jgi:hypothetical protein
MWLQEMFAWVGVLLSAGGAVVSGLNLGRSRWAGLLLGGFLAEATVLAFYRVMAVAIRSEAIGVSSAGAAFLIASIIGLAGRAAIVRGVAGVLSEVGGLAPRGPRAEPVA